MSMTQHMAKKPDHLEIGLSCSEQLGARSLCIPDESGTVPSIQIVTLVPIDADVHVSHTQMENLGSNTYNDLRPAIRGCVAQEPPRVMLCFSSKKSAARQSSESNSDPNHESWLRTSLKKTYLCKQDTEP